MHKSVGSRAKRKKEGSSNCAICYLEILDVQGSLLVFSLKHLAAKVWTMS